MTVSIILTSPHEMAIILAKQVKAKRLSYNLSQLTLAERAGVSYGVFKKFELTGQISIKSLLKIAVVLDSLDAFSNLFKLKQPQQYSSLDGLLNEKKRQRGRL